MSKKPNVKVYVILRYDIGVLHKFEPHQLVTVKEIVTTQELAETETTRLNKLNKHSHYWWQQASFFETGSAGP